MPPGATRDIEFVADNPGDWALHCHKTHHTMNAMSHDLPNMIGVKQPAVEEKVRKRPARLHGDGRDTEWAT